MYGKGSLASGASGLATTVAGVAVLPNTGGSRALMVLGIATIGAGSLVLASFVLTRMYAYLQR